jgi:hypothetical protein
MILMRDLLYGLTQCNLRRLVALFLDRRLVDLTYMQYASGDLS